MADFICDAFPLLEHNTDDRKTIGSWDTPHPSFDAFTVIEATIKAPLFQLKNPGHRK
jgi:hypothetical protein